MRARPCDGGSEPARARGCVLGPALGAAASALASLSVHVLRRPDAPACERTRSAQKEGPTKPLGPKRNSAPERAGRSLASRSRIARTRSLTASGFTQRFRLRARQTGGIAQIPFPAFRPSVPRAEPDSTCLSEGKSGKLADSARKPCRIPKLVETPLPFGVRSRFADISDLSIAGITTCGGTGSDGMDMDHATASAVSRGEAGDSARKHEKARESTRKHGEERGSAAFREVRVVRRPRGAGPWHFEPHGSER